jgi:hypothetical protein
VPKILPKVDTEYKFPAVVPILCRVLAASFIAYGETKPKSIAGNPKIKSVEKNVAVEKSGITPIKNSINEFPMNGINKINNPVENITEHSFMILGLESEIRPPRKYPIVRPVNIIPIKIPHVVVELPKTGVSTLLPVISSAMTIAPEENATSPR